MTILIDYIVPTVHVMACLFLIVVVLLQTGKGADMGAVFGGGSQTLFGSGGAGNLLTKLTTGTAIAFMLTSLVLSYAGQTRTAGSGLIDKLPVEGPPAATAPAPSAAPAAQGTAAIPVEPAPAPAPADAPPAQ